MSPCRRDTQCSFIRGATTGSPRSAPLPPRARRPLRMDVGLTPASSCSARRSGVGARTERLKLYCGLLLVTEAATAGVLLSLDLLLFYLFWEGMLVPLYLLLANYGDRDRGRATLKFVSYTVAGSLLMLLAIICLFLPRRQRQWRIPARAAGGDARPGPRSRRSTS